jgi:ABC-2 type transport system permease protein
MQTQTQGAPGVGEQLRLVNAPVSLWRGTVSDLRDLWESRELLRAFAARELRTRYKGSTLGWAWALVRPLVMLLIYGLAVGVFLGAGRQTPQFMILIYCGLLSWGLFSTIVMGAINSVVANGALLTRASFPRLLLPLSVLLASLVDFALQGSVLLVGYALFRDLPSPRALLWLPPSLLLLVVFALAVGIFFAAVNVYVRDVGFLVDIGLQIGFWLTPVLYSYGQVVRGARDFDVAPHAATAIYMLNPMANVVLGFQEALWPAVSTPAAAAFAFPGDLAPRLAVFTLGAVALLWFASRVYVRLAANFGQEL